MGKQIRHLSEEQRARVAWSRLMEAEDVAAHALINQRGPVGALQYLGQVTAGADPGSDTMRRACNRWAKRYEKLDVDADLEAAYRMGAWVLFPDDEYWPDGLAHLEFAPLVLWGRGDPAHFAMPAVAVVGARSASGYGQTIAGEVGFELAEAGMCVVSGGAYGIDAAAHRGAISASGPTIAVLAGGVDRLYPVGNTDLLHRIIDQGVIVSESPPHSAPSRNRFLTRNRLIAALGQVTTVVEAGHRSGAINTARRAAELGRTVAAFPGPVTSHMSVGCHRLIRDGAVLVSGVEEILELMPHSHTPAVGQNEDGGQKGLLDDLTQVGRRVLDALPVRGATSVEKLAEVAGLGPHEVMTALGQLSLSGHVECRDGRWRRRRR